MISMKESLGCIWTEPSSEGKKKTRVSIEKKAKGVRGEIIAFLLENGPSTVKEICAKIGIDDKKMRNHLNGLVDSKKVYKFKVDTLLRYMVA